MVIVIYMDLVIRYLFGAFIDIFSSLAFRVDWPGGEADRLEYLKQCWLQLLVFGG